MQNMEIWNKVCNTPQDATSTIKAGRLKGFTDINPMWRFHKLTEIFGPAGTGWKAPVADTQFCTGANGEVMVFITVHLSYKVDGEWSEPVIGIGGSRIVEKESQGMHNNDEGLKMAYTDAIGSACKALGMSEDIFNKKYGTKYDTDPIKDTGNSVNKSLPTCANVKFMDGKYNGKTIAEVWKADIDYIKGYLKNGNDIWILKNINDFQKYLKESRDGN